jgi:hypothetical protein
MKKLAFVCYLILSFFISSFGQNEISIQKGRLTIGGSLSFERNNDDRIAPEIDPRVTISTKTTSFTTDINFNYFITNYFTIGLVSDVLISTSKSKNSLSMATTETIRNDIQLGPTIRFYIKSGFFITGSTGIGSLHYDLKESPVKWRNYFFSSGIGYTAFINRSIAIEPIISYKYFNSKATRIAVGKGITNGIVFSTGFQLFFDLKNLKHNTSENE